MSMRGAVAGCVVLVCLMALLVEKTGGHITFFSPKELMLMKEREGKKDMRPRSQDTQFEEITVQQVPQMEHGGTPLDRVTPVLEEIIHEITQERQEAK